MKDMNETKELFIGLMSGTSIDGIDAALVEFDSVNTIKVIKTLFTEFDATTRDLISATAQNNQTLRRNEDSPLHKSLAPLYALACQNLLSKANIPATRVCGIGNHGQTVKHEPTAAKPYSLQLGDGQILANLTGIKTYTQFRQADLAAGGQGAPLMPAFHRALFAEQQNAVILNIGGISNVTLLNEPVIGFDTGPGNVLLDQWIEHQTGLAYDKNGEWAKSGEVNIELLNALLDDPYFSTRPPKSTGTDYFNLAWMRKCHPSLNALAEQDVQATLVQLTVNSVANALAEAGATQGKIYVCGGGANNSLLMQRLASALTAFEVQTTSALGLPSDWVEAAGFAWLGYCSAHGIKSNIPSVTGATSAVVLGEVFTPQH